MRQLPFPDGSFDVVVSSLAIHNIHSNEARAQAVTEAWRVLKPGGRIAIPTFGSPDGTRKHLVTLAQPTSRAAGSAGGSGTATPRAATSLVTAVKR